MSNLNIYKQIVCLLQSLDRNQSKQKGNVNNNKMVFRQTVVF